MLFKLSLKNIGKSIKDYSIYFLTLVLGVAIFYMFNSLDSQQALIVVSRFTKRDNKAYDRIIRVYLSIRSSNFSTFNSICK